MWLYIKLASWGILWIFMWIVTRPFKRKGQENCLTWALHKWRTEEGYLVIRWSRRNIIPWIRWPHIMWLDKEHYRLIQHAVPKKPLGNKIIPPPWFEYKVLKGDRRGFGKEDK